MFKPIILNSNDLAQIESIVERYMKYNHMSTADSVVYARLGYYRETFQNHQFIPEENK